MLRNLTLTKGPIEKQSNTTPRIILAAIIKLASDDTLLVGPYESIFRAGARAHRRTGVPISTHTDTSQQSGLDQQRVFTEEGVDLTRTIIGHSGDATDLDYLRRLLDRGSYLGMDRFGFETAQGRQLATAQQRVDVIAALCRDGYADRLCAVARPRIAA